ncbi:MAG: hypothetical protein ACTSV7_09535 [Candidatus Baldrarchaeia archaeon]
MNNLTLELLRILGSPFALGSNISVSENKLIRLCQLSITNRILFYYLDRVIEKNPAKLVSLYQKERLGYLRIQDAIIRTSQVLTESDIKYAIVKTIRPYKSTTVDIDTLIFGFDIEYKKALASFLKEGYIILGRGPESVTLQDPRIDIKVDLYREIAVSHIIYLDKQKLVNLCTATRLPNGETVTTLTPEADLVTIISHSIIKEHMYTLSEYLSFIHYLKQIDFNDFVEIATENNLTVATRTHATITALLHKVAFGKVPEVLQEILGLLGEATLEAKLVMKNNLNMPHKYHPFTVTRSLAEIMKGEKSRRSMAMQQLHMLKPSFTKEFTKLFIDHLTRETY